MKPSPSYWRLTWLRMRSARMHRLGIYLVLLFFAVAVFAPLLANDRPIYAACPEGQAFPIVSDFLYRHHFLERPQESTTRNTLPSFSNCSIVIAPPIPYSPNSYDLDSILLSPRPGHWFGTDVQGRDILARMIYGAQISLSVGFIAVALYMAIGIALGSLAGYFGGRFDLLLSRAIEIMICFPTFFLILSVLAFVGPSLVNIMIVIGLTGWTGIARLVRGQLLQLRKADYVTAGRALGFSSLRLIFRHILPNAMGPLLVSAVFGISSAILVESGLSFLGFGVQPPTPSWGAILSESHDFIDFAWWLALFPGLAIFLSITSYNLVGEALRDATDPKR